VTKLPRVNLPMIGKPHTYQRKSHIETTPAATKVETPETPSTEVETPAATEVDTPAATKVETPETPSTEVETPAATEVDTPAATEVDTPAATEVETPDVAMGFKPYKSGVVPAGVELTAEQQAVQDEYNLKLKESRERAAERKKLEAAKAKEAAEAKAKAKAEAAVTKAEKQEKQQLWQDKKEKRAKWEKKVFLTKEQIEEELRKSLKGKVEAYEKAAKYYANLAQVPYDEYEDPQKHGEPAEEKVFRVMIHGVQILDDRGKRIRKPGQQSIKNLALQALTEVSTQFNTPHIIFNPCIVDKDPDDPKDWKWKFLHLELQKIPTHTTHTTQ